jgi:hypothetical protein
MTRRSKNSDKQGVTNAPKNTPNRDVNAAQRAALAVELRSRRMTYDQIAQQCGYANASASRKAILRELDRTIVKNVEELRAEELDSLDRLESKCWEIFYDEDRKKGQLFAADRILQVKAQRAKLMGLEVPVKGDIQNNNMVVVREVPAGYLGEVQKSE